MTATTDPRAENERLGAVTGPREVTFVRLLPGPIERVWSFLVDGEKRKRWLAGGGFEPRIGGRATLVFNNSELTAPGEAVPERFAKHAGVMEATGRVMVWEPPHRLAFSWWGEPGATSEVMIDLSEQPDGRVRLTLVHSALKDRNGMLSVSSGWHAHLGVLVDVIEDRAPTRFWTVIDGETEAAYDRLVPND